MKKIGGHLKKINNAIKKNNSDDIGYLKKYYKKLFNELEDKTSWYVKFKYRIIKFINISLKYFFIKDISLKYFFIKDIFSMSIIKIIKNLKKEFKSKYKYFESIEICKRNNSYYDVCDINKYLSGFRSDIKESFNKIKIEKSLKDEYEHDNELFDLMSDKILNYSKNTLRYGNNLYKVKAPTLSRWENFKLKCNIFNKALKATYQNVVVIPYNQYRDKKKIIKNINKYHNNIPNFNEKMYNIYLLNKKIEKKYHDKESI